ncbi:MAG: pyridoxal-phosphate dependent enzyme [Planctomycetota bacterium]
MSLVTKLSCVCCGREYAEGQAMTCPTCGLDDGILDVHYDLSRAARTLSRAALAERSCSLWRYRELLPVDGDPPATLANIGWTPLIETPRLARALGIRRLRLKDDGRSASGSFKDRASAIGVARAIQAGARAIACASTGNAASSLAHCAAAVGLPAYIFVSRIVPEGKLAQLLAYGARVFKVRGTYADAYELCMRACEHFGWYNRNCAVNPYLVEGKKTGGLEIAEQCADDPPDWVVCSVGDGCSIAGVHKGLVQMKSIGVIDWEACMLGVQAAGVAPICEAFARCQTASGSDAHGAAGFSLRGAARAEARGSAIGDTYADSINVPVPRNWRKAVAAVRDSAGEFVSVSDEQIMTAVRQTGALAGIFAEPAAAAAVAGITVARELGIIAAGASVVAMITGSGLKDIAGALRAVGEPHEIPPDLEQVVRVIDSETSTSQ